jgi:intracellular septation protein A
LIGIYIALAWLVVVFIIYYAATRTINAFAIITFLVTLTRFIGGFLQNQLPAFVLTTSVDNTIIGLIFIGSMLMPRPFIMALLDKKTIESTESRFGKSKFWFKAWFDINIIWGLFYVIQGIIVSYAMVLHLRTGEIIDFLLGWPAVLVLLYFSVAYPRIYWTKHMDQMQAEIEAVRKYEEHKTASS